MARTEKTSRARMLPPRARLRREDYTTGSFPTNLRFSTDGRTGNYRVFFDDTYTVLFTSSVGYMPSVGLPVTSPWLALSASSDFRPMTASLLTTGSITKFVVDGLLLEMPVPGRALLPFNDTDNRAADKTAGQDSFYSTGSAVIDVGEGFSSPLWSKQKIEIDIGVVSPSTLTLASASALGASGSSFPMAYYNFTTKTWDPVGLGHAINSFNNISDTVDNFTCGFVNGFLPSNATPYYVNTAGFGVSYYGFPAAPKYHATSSQVFNLSGTITKPFLLEKAVIEMSGTWAIGGVNIGAYSLGSNKTITSSINTCFLLNQRRNQSFAYTKTIRDEGSTPTNFVITASVPVTRRLSTNGVLTYIDTTRDLIGFTQVFSFASGNQVNTSSMNILPDDLVISSSIATISGANWSRPLVLTMTAGTPAATTFPVVDTLLRFFSAGDYNEVPLGYDGYRTGLGLTSISTRGYTNDFFFSQLKKLSVLGTTTMGLPSSKRKNNPYILLPTDQIILGWQLPVSTNPGQLILSNDSESRMTFHTGSFKLVLYGCYMAGNKESIDTTNQLLSSPAIHEAIE